MESVTEPTLVKQLRHLGVRPGATLLAHTAFSNVGPVEGGPEGLIAALREALGPEGTLIMPSMSSDDEHLFDARATPCPEMGIVADTFWRQPGVVRSDNPHAFAAVTGQSETRLRVVGIMRYGARGRSVAGCPRRAASTAAA